MNVFQLVQADLQREGIEQRWDGGQDYSSFLLHLLESDSLKTHVRLYPWSYPNDFFDQSREH